MPSYVRDCRVNSTAAKIKMDFRMARKTQQRWNHKHGYQGGISLAVTPADAGRLGKTAGRRTAADIKKFSEKLPAVSEALKPLWYLQGPDVCPSKVNAALKEPMVADTLESASTRLGPLQPPLAHAGTRRMDHDANDFAVYPGFLPGIQG